MLCEFAVSCHKWVYSRYCGVGSFFDCPDPEQSAIECDAKIFGSLCLLDIVAVNLYFLTGLDEFVKVMDCVFFGFPFLEVFC